MAGIDREVFVACAKAQRLALPVVQQAGDEFLEFTGPDFLSNGGWLTTKVWEVLDLGDGFRIQMALSGLVDDEGQPKMAAAPRSDRYSFMDLKFTRFVVPKAGLDPESAQALAAKAKACAAGEELSCWLAAGEDALLQFELTQLAVNTAKHGRVWKLFGCNVYFEGMTFTVPSAQALGMRRQAKSISKPKSDLVAEVFGGAVAAPHVQAAEEVADAAELEEIQF